MAKARDYHLKKGELAELEIAIRRDKRPEVRQRSMAIHLLHLGHKAEDVAQMHSVSKPTIYGWWNRWCAGGVEGLANRPKSGRPGIEELANRPKSGRPPKADEAYIALVEEIVEQSPSELGYGFTIWTIDRLRAHLAQATGIELSEPAFRALLKKQDYRYRRPKHDLRHLQDPEAKADADELLDRLKKRSAETISHSSLWTKQP
jgi:transposase